MSKKKTTMRFSRGKLFFDWDVTDLENYIEQNMEDLATRIVDSPRTAQLLKTKSGLKGTQELDDVDVAFTWQDGKKCKLDESGTVSFGKKEITVADIGVKLTFCNKDLIDYLPQTKLKPGAAAELEEMPFEAIVVDLILQKNNMKIEDALWRSDKNSSDPDLNKFDALLKQIDADGDVITLIGQPGVATEITSANAYDQWIAFSKNTPRKLRRQSNFAWVTDEQSFFELREALATKYINSTQYDIMSNQEIEGEREVVGIKHPVTLEKIYWVPGLDGTGRVIGGLWGSNGQFYLGTDLDSDVNNIKVKYDEFEEIIEVILRFRIGTTYRISENVVSYRPTAS